jgi:hypothetical protein
MSAVLFTGDITQHARRARRHRRRSSTARLIAGDAFGSVATNLALDAAKQYAQRRQEGTQTFGSARRSPDQAKHSEVHGSKRKMARPERFELPTLRSVV